jgi:hypothetical protein
MRAIASSTARSGPMPSVTTRWTAYVRDHEWQSGPIWDENVWGNAVHRVVTEGIGPERAVDDAIARIKQILSE